MQPISTITKPTTTPSMESGQTTGRKTPSYTSTTASSPSTARTFPQMPSTTPSASSSPTAVENFPSNYPSSPYRSRTGDKITGQPKKEEPPQEVEMIQKIQPQNQTWWENMLGNLERTATRLD